MNIETWKFNTHRQYSVEGQIVYAKMEDGVITFADHRVHLAVLAAAAGGGDHE